MHVAPQRCVLLVGYLNMSGWLHVHLDVKPLLLSIFISLPPWKNDACVKYKLGLFARKMHSSVARFWVKKSVKCCLELMITSRMSLLYSNINSSCDLVSVGKQPIKSHKNELSAERYSSFLSNSLGILP